MQRSGRRQHRFYRGSNEPMNPMPRRTIHKSFDEPVVLGPNEEGIWNVDYYGGDLKGITDKLDYIKSLGVDIIFLSPIVYAQSNHRYDASDYEKVDPYAGSYEDLKVLCEEAHKKGIKVIVDGVFNHTGSDSKYFNKLKNQDWISEENDHGAYYDENSKYQPFYKKAINKDTGKLDFCYWWTFDTLPVCDSNGEEWTNFIAGPGGIIDIWFKCGIDGLRLDVADDLSDQFIEKIKRAVHRNKKDGFILGEVWENPMYMNRGYLESGKGLDSVMNYNLMKGLIKYFRYGDVDALKYKIREIQSSYPDDAINAAMNFTSTHDITRGINLWDKDIFDYYGKWPWNLIDEGYQFAEQYHLTKEQYEEYKKIYLAYVFCLNFMPGTLSIFYGDEIGMQGIGNLDNRKPFNWNQRDEEIFAFFKRMGEIRKQNGFMHEAELRVRDININYLAFERLSKEAKAFIIVNRTPMEQKFSLPSEYSEYDEVYQHRDNEVGSLKPYGGMVLKKKINRK